MSSSPGVPQYQFIDAIRGIAILLVLLVHVAQRFPVEGGVIQGVFQFAQMGVQLFFFASAYTLCNSWFNRVGGERRVLLFYVRRLFRIWPAYCAAILFYVLFDIAVDGEVDVSLASVLANLFLVHGFFPAANNSVVPGGWSIATEVLFYVLFPPLMVVMEWVGSLLRYRLLVLTVLTLFVMGCSWFFDVISVWELENNSFPYFSILVQFPVFALGVAYYFSRDRMAGLSPIFCFSASVVLFFGLAVLFPVYKDEMALVYPSLAGVCFLFLFDALSKVELDYGVLARIGVYSYSMYLVHYLFANKAAALTAPLFVALGGAVVGVLIHYTVSLIVVFYLARLSHYLIEVPSMAMGRNVAKSLLRSHSE